MKVRRGTAGALVCVGLLGLAANAGHAATWYVDDDTCPLAGDGSDAFPFCSIQLAMAFAVDGDEVVVRPGTYDEAIDFAGKSIWLHSSAGADVTIISGVGALHVITCRSGEGPETILEGFTITGGNANGVGADGRGGGLYTTGDPTVIACLFTANDAIAGGGLFAESSSAEIRDCTFTANGAVELGGGMTIDGGSPIVIDCHFDGNSAAEGGGLGIVNGAAPALTGTTFHGNTAAQGGGLMTEESSPTLLECTFSANRASSGTERFGGGMIARGGVVVVTDTVFDSNQAVRGAGIANLASSPTFIGCSFIGNAASERGGGAYSRGAEPPATESSEPTFDDCMFEANTASYGGAIANDAWGDEPTGPPARPVVTSGVFVNNTAARGGAIWSLGVSGVEVAASSFIGNDGSWGGALYQEAGSIAAVTDSAFLGNTGDYGGAVHERNDCASIFTRCSFVANVAAAWGGAVYGLHSSPRLIESALDGNRASWGGAIMAEGVRAWPVIEDSAFHGNLAGEHGGAAYFRDSYPTFGGSTFTENRAWQFGGAIRIDRGSTAEGGPYYLVLTDSTFEHNWSSRAGAAVFVYQASPTIERCNFEHNYSLDVGGGVSFWAGSAGRVADCDFSFNSTRSWGGAFNVETGSTPLVERCSFTRNLAEGGGGALHSYAGAASFLDCTFVENSAWDHGGAVSERNGSSTSFVNVVFRDNHAWDNGGAFYDEASAPSLMNCLFAGNLALRGGAIYNAGGSPELTHATFVDNVATIGGQTLYTSGAPKLRNSIAWSGAFGPEIIVTGGTTTVSYSTVRGGWTGPGEGNIASEPDFVDAAAGNFRLAFGSPGIDAGSNALVPPDDDDLDGDGDTTEGCPVDLDRAERFVDDPATPDTGFGDPPLVDMGAYEYQPSACPADLDGDGAVNVGDLLIVLGGWGTDAGDIDGDGMTDVSDLLQLLGAWGLCD